MARVVIRLIRPDAAILDAAIAGDDALAQVLGHPVVRGWASFTEALRRDRDALAARPEHVRWGPRLFVAGDPPELVGWGGFKGPPQDGVVELGYEIGEPRRNRGLATAAVRAMVSEASGEPAVAAVIAHTLPQRNASTRVLEKAGFDLDGTDSANGATVWRFTRPLRTRE